MSLQEKLDAFRDAFQKRQPPEVVETMRRATADLIASGQAGRALKAGDAAPTFSLPDEEGRPVSLRELLAKGTLVLTFYRGTWCPYCNTDLQALQAELPAIEAAGGTMAAISPQTAANSRRARRDSHLTFPILTDKGNEVAAAFGLRFRMPDDLIAIYKGFGNDLATVNAEPSWTLPMPARYVIGTDGRILHAEVNPDYTRRPEPSTLLPVLRQAALVRA
ncbi:MAG TPA: peroxiredoxin-like family protein [Acetobacteraceae bacterium]